MKPRLNLRILRALETALIIMLHMPRGGDLPDEENMTPDDPTDEDFNAAYKWVRASIDKISKGR